MDNINISRIEKTITHRYLARIVIESEKPLVIHAGKKDVLTDAVVMKDVNELPYIPGSSIAGVIRHAWKDAGKDIDQLFGFQKNSVDEKINKSLVDENEPQGLGSRIIFTEARILNSEGDVVDGLQPDVINDDSLLKEYLNLPVRQHVRITHRGVAAKNGKFDEEIVYAGTRFCFEMEMIGDAQDETVFSQLIQILKGASFRLGSGSRKGFGKIKIVDIRYCSLLIDDKEYLEKSSNLKESETWYKKFAGQLPEVEPVSKPMEELCYQLRPENFFLFGSGFGDDEVDMTPVQEQRVKWDESGDKPKGELKNREYLIPASSVKGALAHRVAFHYNVIEKFFADEKTAQEIEAHSGSNNEAVCLLFGTAGDEDGDGKQRGNIIFSDIYFVDNVREKIFNHVAIDRFTGGAIDGALFAEKTAYWHGTDDGYPLELDILIDGHGIRKCISKHNEKSEKKVSYETIRKALDAALSDLCEGRLSLGGGVNRGYGIFTGKKTEK